MGIILATVAIFISPACYLPPVAAPVGFPYIAPACQYCAGHRGIEYTTAPGTAVHATAPGEVTFAGVVVGTRYVVVLHLDGISATYGDLASDAVAPGDKVVVGALIGTTTADLYFGLRRDERSLDPADFLAVIRHRPRLVPSGGARPRPAPPGQPVCPGPGR